MKQLFQIKDDKPTEDEPMLLCEIGEQYLVAAEYISEKKQVHTLSYFTYSFDEAGSAIKNILEQHLHLSNQKTFVASAFPEATLIPEQLFDATAPQKYFLASLGNKQFLNEPIAEWKMVLAYSIPQEIHHFFLQKQGTVTFHHAYTTELKIYNGYVATDQISIHFNPQQFRVLVKKEGGVQLAQMYAYTSPLDVVYYLIKIMDAFELRKEDTFCILSGLIDKDSSLYTELSNYFLNLQFASPAVTLPQNEYPAHFFTSILNLAACVS